MPINDLDNVKTLPIYDHLGHLVGWRLDEDISLRRYEDERGRKMPLAADTAQEVYDRTKASTQGAVTTIRKANQIQLVTVAGGAVTVNVDGLCMLQIAVCQTVIVDQSNALSTDNVLTANAPNPPEPDANRVMPLNPKIITE
jgi:hypothetical protein